MEFRAVWQACPHVQHPRCVVYIEADTAELARAVLKDDIERRWGYEWFTIHALEEAPARPPGRVLHT